MALKDNLMINKSTSAVLCAVPLKDNLNEAEKLAVLNGVRHLLSERYQYFRSGEIHRAPPEFYERRFRSENYDFNGNYVYFSFSFLDVNMQSALRLVQAIGMRFCDRSTNAGEPRKVICGLHGMTS